MKFVSFVDPHPSRSQETEPVLEAPSFIFKINKHKGFATKSFISYDLGGPYLRVSVQHQSSVMTPFMGLITLNL